MPHPLQVLQFYYPFRGFPHCAAARQYAFSFSSALEYFRQLTSSRMDHYHVWLLGRPQAGVIQYALLSFAGQVA